MERLIHTEATPLAFNTSRRAAPGKTFRIRARGGHPVGRTQLRSWSFCRWRRLHYTRLRLIAAGPKRRNGLGAAASPNADETKHILDVQSRHPGEANNLV
jgi:hypothetical protein